MPIAGVNGISIYYQVDGEGSRAFLLFNGASLSVNSWDYMMPGLVTLGRVVRFDVRGIGQTPAAQAPYALKDIAADAASLLEHLKLGKVIVLAHAYGGRVAQIFARDHPDRIQGLILCGTGGLYPPLPPVAPANPADLEARVEAWFGTYFGSQFRNRHPERAAQIIERFRARMQMVVPGAQAARQPLLQAELPESYWGKAPETLPVLLVYGTEDRFGHEKNARDLAQRFRNSKLVFIENAGHMAIQEEPERIIAEIAAFLKEHNL